MTKTNQFSLAVGILEITVIGLLLCVNPDYFFNPMDGLFQSFSFLTEGAIIPPFVKLDNLTYYSLACYGTGCLAIGGMYLLAGKDYLLKREILRSKFWLAALSAHVLVHTAFVYDDILVGINKPVVAFLGGLSAANALWILSDMIGQHFNERSIIMHRTPPIQKSKATSLQFMTLLLDCLFTGVWAVQLLWFPRNFEPGNLMATLKTTPKEDNTFMDITFYTVRMEGVPMLTFTLCMLELILFDRSVEAIRANNKFALVCFFLYTLNWVRAFLWCEHADKIAIATNVLINVGFGIFIYKCGPSVFEEQPVKAASVGGTKDKVLKSEAPDLIAESKNKVQ